MVNCEDAEREQRTVKWTVKVAPGEEWKRHYAVRYFVGTRGDPRTPVPEVLGQ